MSYINNLMWRYATKKFDSEKKLDQDQLNILLKTLNFAPSSFGLQPYKFIVIEDKETRNSLLEATYNQPQITDASHMIVLCARTDVNEEMVNEYIERMLKITDVSEDSIAGYKQMMLGFVSQMSAEELVVWAKNQVYLALGFLLDAAAQNKIDACPMEGFSPQEYDELLGLSEMNLTATVVCTLGFRSSEDKYADRPKVRHDLEDIIINL